MALLPRALRIYPLRFTCGTVLVLAAHTMLAAPQQAPGAAPKQASQKTQVDPPVQAVPDRSSSYYHYGLAHFYEEMAISLGRSDYATQAIEEYKLALNADPNSVLLQDGLADLYFKIGRNKDAVAAAQDQVKKNPDDIAAHNLLGKIYLRQLSDTQDAQAGGQVLQLAIAEYETISRLKPNDIETTLLLGQLYALNHDSAKAEEKFKAAQKIDANSEEVVLNMARLYGEEGDVQRAADALSAVPVEDRTARIEFALGATLDQLKKPKEAAAAYRRSLDIEPDNPDGERGLANALLMDDQFDEALKVFNQLLAADPTDSQSQIHIAEIQRRQGHYEDALATLEKAKSSAAPASLELSYNEALIYDALGKYDQATGVLTTILDSSSHPDGKYSDEEKQNRAIFLNRLGVIYREQNKTTEAVAAYKQMIDMGGDELAEQGYQGEVDSYRDAHQWKDATTVAAEAAKALPKDRSIQLMYAGLLADTGKVEEGLGLAKAQLGQNDAAQGTTTIHIAPVKPGAADSPALKDITVPGVAADRDREVEEDLAQIYIRLKRFKESSDELDKAAALATKPDDKLYVYFLRGELYDRQKMYGEAEAEFRKALAIDPQNPAVLNYLGYMLADQGEKLPEALQMIRHAVELDPQNGAYLDSLGWVYFKSGQYAQAEENLRKANERINTDPTVHDHLGEVYEKTGNLKMAVAQWERSMTEYAHSLRADAEPEDVQKVQHKLENARVKLAKLNTASDKEAK